MPFFLMFCQNSPYWISQYTKVGNDDIARNLEEVVQVWLYQLEIFKRDCIASKNIRKSAKSSVNWSGVSKRVLSICPFPITNKLSSNRWRKTFESLVCYSKKQPKSSENKEIDEFLDLKSKERVVNRMVSIRMCDYCSYRVPRRHVTIMKMHRRNMTPQLGMNVPQKQTQVVVARGQGR